MRNKSSPKTDPWGTPDSIEAHSDSDPLTLTLCFQFLRYFVKRAKMEPSMPFRFNLNINLSYSLVCGLGDCMPVGLGFF